ncbi:bifunctional adenosylcobinamide kinase/adenosylcobinamide-phosphate guanylyltransferase [Bacillus tianshenii]|nr:bifunctional adenosylcobinamide kinase/adenosylcobinamide-phosphate guanylyltransferase [Bacillus tianshenii]
MLIFVSGGVRSGKSSFAEQYACHLAEDTCIHYIATSTITDNEMKQRIQKHQNDRAASPYEWKTWEQPRNLENIIPQFSITDTVLIDCLTVWLSNELFINDIWQSAQQSAFVVRRMKETIEQYQKQCLHVIVVSNDLFYDGMPEDVGSKCYLSSLGKLHQEIVEIADEAYQAEFGLVQAMKEGNS